MSLDVCVSSGLYVFTEVSAGGAYTQFPTYRQIFQSTANIKMPDNQLLHSQSIFDQKNHFNF